MKRNILQNICFRGLQKKETPTGYSFNSTPVASLFLPHSFHRFLSFTALKHATWFSINANEASSFKYCFSLLKFALAKTTLSASCDWLGKWWGTFVQKTCSLQPRTKARQEINRSEIPLPSLTLYYNDFSSVPDCDTVIILCIFYNHVPPPPLPIISSLTTPHFTYGAIVHSLIQPHTVETGEWSAKKWLVPSLPVVVSQFIFLPWAFFVSLSGSLLDVLNFCFWTFHCWLFLIIMYVTNTNIVFFFLLNIIYKYAISGGGVSTLACSYMRCSGPPNTFGLLKG